MDTLGLSVKNITKKYDTLLALKDISFDVKRGELFGLVGPDGAGKSTMFKIIVTLLKADSGVCYLEGLDVAKSVSQVRDIIGYMPGKFSLYQDLSIRENLEFFATAFGTSIEENFDLIKDIYLQIEPFENRRAGALSGGMKQKLALCCALIHNPKVLLLDEPTTGVDAVSRKEFWQMLKQIQKQNITIIVSTPYMDEASLCDRIALIQQGEILSLDKPDEIAKSFPLELYKIEARNMYTLLNTLRSWDKTEYCYAFGEFLHWASKNSSSSEEIINYLLSKGFDNMIVKKTEPVIEDTFMYLMQKK